MSILITGNPDHGQNHVISRILRSKSCDLDRDQDLGDLASGTLHRRKVPLAGSPQGRIMGIRRMVLVGNGNEGKKYLRLAT